MTAVKAAAVAKDRSVDRFAKGCTDGAAGDAARQRADYGTCDDPEGRRRSSFTEKNAELGASDGT